MYFYKTDEYNKIITYIVDEEKFKDIYIESGFLTTEKEIVNTIHNGFVFADELNQQNEEQALLDEIKASKIAELKSARDAEELSPIEYNGFLWDFDDKAQMRINGAIIVLGNNSITWTSADNQEVNGVTVEHLKAIVAQASIRSNAVHVKYRQLKALVEEAETVEAVNAIKWGE